MTIILFLGITFGLYAYLVKFHTSAMMPVIRSTQAYLSPIHDLLGVTGVTEGASQAPVENIRPTPPLNEPALPVAPVVHPAPVPAAMPAPAVGPVAKNENDIPIAYITVSSKPSGATILIDERQTGLITPSRVPVPNDRAFKLTLARQGYVNFVKPDMRAAGNSSFAANLVESVTGTLDIDVIPPKDVRLWINGAEQTKHPFHNITVPAGVPLRLRMEDASGTFEETSVELRRSQHKKLVFNMYRRSN